MSGRAKSALLRVLERIIVGPQCACGHDVAIHSDETGHCLGANYDRGTHIGWCTCSAPHSKKKEKATK